MLGRHWFSATDAAGFSDGKEWAIPLLRRAAARALIGGSGNKAAMGRVFGLKARLEEFLHLAFKFAKCQICATIVSVMNSIPSPFLKGRVGEGFPD